jgi:hypothetical protein
MESVAQRVQRALAKRGASSFFGLQYRLGEVGRNRTNPLLLEHFLREHNNRTADEVLGPSFYELEPGIYSDRGLPITDARIATDRAMAALDRLRHQDWAEAFRVIKEELLGEPKTARILETTTIPRPAGEQMLEVFAQALACDWANGSQAVVWVSHDTNWVFPHDYRLWRALEAGFQLRLPVLIVARQLAPATFVLLKAVQANAVQFYSSIVDDESVLAARRDAETAGWFHVRAASSLKDHPARTQIANGLARLALVKHRSPIDEAILLGAKSGLVNPNATLSDLVSWAADASELGLDLPARWVETLSSWSSWPIEQQGRTAVENTRAKAEFGRKTEVSRIGIRV